MFGDNSKNTKKAAKVKNKAEKSSQTSATGNTGTDGEIKTIFGSGTRIEGDINTNGSLRVEGEIDGTIKADGDLFVGEEGSVQTEVEARKVVIAGTVKGNVLAHEKLEILPSGYLDGDIKTDTLKIEEGAVFVGSSQTLSEATGSSGSDKKTTSKQKGKKSDKGKDKKSNNSKKS